MTTLEVELAQLEYAQLVRALAEEELAYMFRHTLTQETAYDSLLVKKRHEIHRRVAEGYEHIYADRLAEYIAVLAYHYAQAGDDAKTMEYSLQAADAAMRVFAYPEALGHYTRGLDAFRRLPDTQEYRRRRVDAVFWYIEAAWGTSDPRELLHVVSEAETLARSLEKPDGTTGDPLLLVRIHQQLTGLYIARGEYQEVIRYARLGLDEASELEHKTLADKTSEAPHAAQLGIALMAQGHFADAVPFLSRAIALAEETPNRWEWFDAVGSLGITLVMQGHVAAGLAETERALARLQATNNQVGTTHCQALLLVMNLERGDISGLLEQSERAVAAAAKTGVPLFESLGLGFKSLAQSRLGQHPDAQETMKASRAIAAQLGGQFLMWDWLAAVEAELAHNAGRMEDAIALAERTVAISNSIGGIFSAGWARRVWADALAASVPPQWEDAQIHLATSCELFESGGALLEAARTHVAWGQMLRTWGKAEEARAHFVKAAAQFQTSGLMDELGRTQELIDSLSA